MPRNLEEVLGPMPERRRTGPPAPPRVLALSDAGWMIAGNVLAALGALFALTGWLSVGSIAVAAVPIVAAVLVGRAARRGAALEDLRRAMRLSVAVLTVAAILHVYFSGYFVYDFFFADHGETGLELLALVVPIFLLFQFAATAVVIKAAVVAARAARAAQKEAK